MVPGHLGWVNQDAALTTVEIDLVSGVACEQGLTFADSATDIRAMYIWFSPGEFDIDNVRGE